jgi:chromosome segregation ATPase
MANEQAHPSLQLDRVTKGFADAEETLRSLQNRLRGLVEAYESAQSSASRLGESSTALTHLAKSMQDVARELAETQQRMRDVITASAAVLDGSDLKRVVSSVDDLGGRLTITEKAFTTELKEVTERMAEQTQHAEAAIVERVETLERKMADAGAARAEAEEARAKLERVKGVLYFWQRRKLGLKKQ